MAFHSLFARDAQGKIIFNPDALAAMGLPTEPQRYTINGEVFEHKPTPKQEAANATARLEQPDQ